MNLYSRAAICSLLLFQLSCKDTEVASCGCDSRTVNTLNQEEGQIKIDQVGNVRLFRIINPSKDLYLAICDSAVLDQSTKTNNTKVRFNAQVKVFCTEPNVRYLPPLYLPTRITQMTLL